MRQLLRPDFRELTNAIFVRSTLRRQDYPVLLKNPQIRIRAQLKE